MGIDRVLVWCRYCRTATPVTLADLGKQTIPCADCGGGIWLRHPTCLRLQQEAAEAKLKAEMGSHYVTAEQAAARRKAYEAEQMRKRRQPKPAA